MTMDRPWYSHLSLRQFLNRLVQPARAGGEHKQQRRSSEIAASLHGRNTTWPNCVKSILTPQTLCPPLPPPNGLMVTAPILHLRWSELELRCLRCDVGLPQREPRRRRRRRRALSETSASSVPLPFCTLPIHVISV